MPKYTEGDWFAVPLPNGGFGVGVLARANRGGVLLGYFFGPRREAVPPPSDLSDLQPSRAVLIRKFGHLGLRSGKWPIVGRTTDWDREAWPVPTFVRHEELTGRTYEVIYDEDDPNRVVREEPSTPEATRALPRDGLAGPGFLERQLAELLG
jgi:hypothetical protein